MTERCCSAMIDERAYGSPIGQRLTCHECKQEWVLEEDPETSYGSWEPTAATCTAIVCREDSRDIPEIGSTGMRKGKQTLTVDGKNLGWTHLNCEADDDA